MYHYSPTQNTFYPDELKQVYIDAGTFPADTVEVSDDVWLEFAGNHPPEGKQRAAGSDNLPCWVDIPLPDIEDVRKQKYAEINKWRDVQENASYTFKFKDHTWDYGKASQARLQPVAALAKNGQLPNGFFWTDAHNHDVPITAGEVLELESAMVGAMVAKGFEIHQHQRSLKETLAKLTTVEDVLAFKVE
ncbi:DUF4376 domain-containing protein [Salmonella enterica subsp. enterica]|nr:DUF4376 domain-containing protein [Salmonella enterica subsp. enterica]EGT9726312.1 DUF4376 domain-containing protein [Salmonella enterica]EHV9882964.1 DUF4376 domain-containing protein [Salmonella enterica subsp. enterica serovar Durham]EIP0098515.1 DUF4376 domain-containing protein [Salmonella enterica subsp. enterica serovar Wangata]EEC0436469.1 DUF4376 domain-containing protein [Salmonella enterica subsp. enterica]